MPVAERIVRSPSSPVAPSEILRGAGFVDRCHRGGLAVGGKRFGAGEDEAAVGVALTMAIEFFSKNKRSGQMDIAMMLRRIFVEHLTVRAASAKAGIHRVHAYRLVREFKAELRDVCARNMWDPQVVMR